MTPERFAPQSGGGENSARRAEEVNGGAIAIDAKVTSCAERDALIELASCRRGIVSVEDRVIVQPTPTQPNPRTS